MALTIDDKIAVRQIANEEVQYSLGETNQRLTAVEDRLAAVEDRLAAVEEKFDVLTHEVTGLKNIMVLIASNMGIEVPDQEPNTSRHSKE